MKKTIVILLALILAGPSTLRAEPQDDLKGKVVRISGAVNGMGVVLLYKAGYCLMFEDIDDLQRQTHNLKNQDYRLVILAESREAYLQMLSDGLTPAEIAARVKPAQARSDLTDLFEIAENARKKRIAAGIPFLLGGGSAIILPLINLVANGFSDGGVGPITPLYFIMAGGMIASGVGILNLSLKSSAERRYNQALKLSAEERDVFCAATLKRESSQAKFGRFVSAYIYSGLAAVFLLQASADVYELEDKLLILSVIALGTSALYKLIFPSYEERTYRRYLQEKAVVEQSNKLTLNIGMVPRGFAVGVRYYFQ